MFSSRLVARYVTSVLVAAPLLLAGTSAFGGTLEGQLVDSMTGTPIPDATVRVVGTPHHTTTDAQGNWSFELPQGEYALTFEKRLGGRLHEFRLVNQHVPQYKPADSWIATDYYLKRGAERLDRPVGAPTARIPHPSNRDRGTIDLDDHTGVPKEPRPRAHTIPDSPPTTIRVARRDDKENCSNPIVAIEEMTLDEYVRGVLPPEIGVFRNIDNVGEVYRAFALAAKSYGLYFMLVHDADNRRTVDSPKPPNDYEWFHIDDTPCNQRYSDRRLDKTNAAAEATQGELLVKDGAPDKLDKYEYAASCAEHGTRPEYQDAIVPDETPARACVGDWCGHDDCAGHADHPDVPGEDSCLVRGICQWGAAEWAKGGKDAAWLLDHYQPNLKRRRLWDDSNSETVDLKGFVHTDPDDPTGSGIAGATVELGDDRSTTTVDTGEYTFSDVQVSRGSVTLRAAKTGYESAEKSATLQSGEVNRINLHLERRISADAGSDAGDAGADADTDGLPADATSASPEVGPYGGLGPLLTRSRGARREGCSIVTNESPRPGWPGLVFGVSLVLGLGLRRRLRR